MFSVNRFFCYFSNYVSIKDNIFNSNNVADVIKIIFNTNNANDKLNSSFLKSFDNKLIKNVSSITTNSIYETNKEFIIIS